MTNTTSNGAGPILLCFDGSDDASNAIDQAGQLFGSRRAVVLTVCEPMRLWSPSDPATLLDAPLGRLFSKVLELDEIVEEVAREQVNRGVELARATGFDAEGHIAHGKAWREICTVVQEVDAAAIVLGARGLSRVQSALLGSVSAAVSTHARRPVLIVHRARSGQPTAAV